MGRSDFAGDLNRMSQPQDQWKIEVNDRLCALVDVVLGLATGALVLPAVFLRSFLAVPESQSLLPMLRPSAYVAVVAFSVAIFLGLVFRYTSAKWVKQAWGKATGIGAVGLERILDWTFWLMVVAFLTGVAG